MTVYVVLEGEYEDVWVYGVFSSRGAAEAALLTPKGKRKRGCWEIQERTLDTPFIP